MDESRNFGFIFRKMGLSNTPGAASLDFFLGDGSENPTKSFKSLRFNLGSDLIDDDERVLFDNY